VGFGSCVEFEDSKSGKTQTYTLVSAHEADPTQGSLSIDSPMGKALLGTKIGGVAKFESPRGVRELKVLRITTEQ
jgi:transcription elongation factor GreA